MRRFDCMFEFGLSRRHTWFENLMKKPALSARDNTGNLPYMKIVFWWWFVSEHFFFIFFSDYWIGRKKIGMNISKSKIFQKLQLNRMQLSSMQLSYTLLELATNPIKHAKFDWWRMPSELVYMRRRLLSIYSFLLTHQPIDRQFPNTLAFSKYHEKHGLVATISWVG